MKVKVNKNQWLDDHEREMIRNAVRAGYSISWRTPASDFEEMDVTMEELKDLIEKGYGIRINC